MNVSSKETSVIWESTVSIFSTEGYHEGPKLEDIVHEMEIVMEDVFRAVNAIGAIENFLVCILLYQMRRKDLLAPMPFFLLCQQAFFDCCSAALAFLVSFDLLHYFEQGDIWNYLACHIWDTSALFTLFYLYSDYNHVLFTSMIFLSIRFPIYYFTMKKNRSLIMFSFYLLFFSYNFPVFYRLFYDPASHTCIDQWSWDVNFDFFHIYTYTEVLVDFFIPLMLVIFLNASIIRHLKSKSLQILSGSESAGGAGHGSYHGPELRGEASRSLLKISLALTISFLLFSTYMTVFEFLVALNIWHKSFDSLEGNLAILIETASLSINPILILFFLPSLRKQIFLWWTGHSRQSSSFISSSSSRIHR